PSAASPAIRLAKSAPPQPITPPRKLPPPRADSVSCGTVTSDCALGLGSPRFDFLPVSCVSRPRFTVAFSFAPFWNLRPLSDALLRTHWQLVPAILGHPAGCLLQSARFPSEWTDTHGTRIENRKKISQKTSRVPPHSPETFRRIHAGPARFRNRRPDYLRDRQGTPRSPQAGCADRHHGRRRQYFSRRASKRF